MKTGCKLWWGFAGVAALYLIASVVTIATGAQRFRVLYEGIGPSPAYRWVHPPPVFKSTNIAPLATSLSIQLNGGGSEQSGAATIDGQLVLALAAGAVPAAGGQISVSVSMTPFDPAKLGRLPAGLFSDGNAYLVSVTYEPSGRKIGSAAKPIDAVLRTPVSSVALLASADGKTWVRIPDHHIAGQAAVAATFMNFGYLLAAANAPVVPTSSSSATSVTLIVLLGVAAAGLVTLSVLLRRRQRSRRS